MDNQVHKGLTDTTSVNNLSIHSNNPFPSYMPQRGHLAKITPIYGYSYDYMVCITGVLQYQLPSIMACL